MGRQPRLKVRGPHRKHQYRPRIQEARQTLGSKEQIPRERSKAGEVQRLVILKVEVKSLQRNMKKWRKFLRLLQSAVASADVFAAAKNKGYLMVFGCSDM